MNVFNFSKWGHRVKTTVKEINLKLEFNVRFVEIIISGNLL